VDDHRGPKAADLAATLRDEIRASLEADLASSRGGVSARMAKSPQAPAAQAPDATAPAPEATRFGAPSRCPSCSGSGQSHFGGSCGVCSGSGFIGTY
jgi:hypothetical protein